MAGIVVGFDGSPRATVALRWAHREAVAHRTALTVVAVVEEGYVAGTAVIEPASAAEIEREQGRIRQEVAAAVPDGAASVVVRPGQPVVVLLEESADAEQLVVGSRGRGGVSRLLLGSVSSQVVHHSRCPVTVVPDGS